MADQNNQSDTNESSMNQGATNQAGDPGTTPGSAEGDEKTVDQSIQQKENAGK